MSDQPQAQPQVDEADIRLNFNEINFVLNALAKAPFEQVKDLIYKVHQQAEAALQAAQIAKNTGETK